MLCNYENNDHLSSADKKKTKKCSMSKVLDPCRYFSYFSHWWSSSICYVKFNKLVSDLTYCLLHICLFFFLRGCACAWWDWIIVCVLSCVVVIGCGVIQRAWEMRAVYKEANLEADECLTLRSDLWRVGCWDFRMLLAFVSSCFVFIISILMCFDVFEAFVDFFKQSRF